MWSGPCVATTIACGGLFGLTRLAFGSDSWNDGAPELNAVTRSTMKIAKQTTLSTARRPPRLESPRRRRSARKGGREETIARTLARQAERLKASDTWAAYDLAPRARGAKDPDSSLD